MEHGRLVRIAMALVLGSALSAAVSGCPRHRGPAERAGEAIDEGVEDVEDEVDEATE